MNDFVDMITYDNRVNGQVALQREPRTPLRELPFIHPRGGGMSTLSSLINCVVCGNAFNRKPAGRKTAYCSRRCRLGLTTFVNTCLTCGVEFCWITKGKRKFCSKPCAYKWNAIVAKTRHQHKCESCGIVFKSSQPRAKFCSCACATDKRRRTQKYPCKYCGKSYRPKNKSFVTFCSRECSFEARKSGNGWPHRPPTYKEKPCSVCTQLFQPTGTMHLVCPRCAPPKWSNVYFPTCIRCKRQFSARQSNRKCCSQACSYAAALAAQHDRYMSREPITKSCQHCGQPFVLVLRQDRLFCSTKCMRWSAKRDDKHKRRLRLQSAHREVVRLGVVMIRDSKVCQICKKRVMDTKVPHPKAPTLDHIVPLSKGGTHEYRNIQLAHFMCNSKRSDKGSAQLRLM